jgi:integrase
MRRGELLNLRWSDIDLQNRTLHIPQTKNGHARTIPVSYKAIEVLSGLDREGGDQVFPLSAYAVRHAWNRLTKRAGIADLHFHDLRHEAISRFFEKGLSVAEVALISGHRDFRQLFRYTHLRAEDVARKL